MSDEEEGGGSFWDQTLGWLQGNSGTVGRIGGEVVGTVVGGYLGNPTAGNAIGGQLGGAVGGAFQEGDSVQVGILSGAGASGNQSGGILGGVLGSNNPNRVWVPPNGQGQGGDALVSRDGKSIGLFDGGRLPVDGFTGPILGHPAQGSAMGPQSQSWAGEKLRRVSQAGHSLGYVVDSVQGKPVVVATLRDPQGRVLASRVVVDLSNVSF